MRCAWFYLGVGLATVLTSGCVERRFVIMTDPPGAVVERNGQVLGATPVDDHFVYYGKYKFKIVKPGYETLQVDQEISTPWYEYPGLDFISENLVPGEIRDERVVEYQLQPQMVVPTEQLRERGENLRQGASGPPVAAPPAPPSYGAPPESRPGPPASPPPATRPGSPFSY